MVCEKIIHSDSRVLNVSLVRMGCSDGQRVHAHLLEMRRYLCRPTKPSRLVQVPRNRRPESGMYSVRCYPWPGHGGRCFLHRRWVLSECPRSVEAQLPRPHRVVLVLPNRSDSSHRVSQREFVPYFGCHDGADAVCQGSYGAAYVAIFRRETAETKALNKTLKERRDTREKIHDVSIPTEKRSFPDRKTFTWEAVNYVVPVPGGTLRLLHDVYGYVKPGTLTALMGASGAGKTTALDVLAQRKNIGVITGDLLVDGKPLGPSFARTTAYGSSFVLVAVPPGANRLLENS